MMKNKMYYNSAMSTGKQAVHLSLSDLSHSTVSRDVAPNPPQTNPFSLKTSPSVTHPDTRSHSIYT